MLFYGFNAGASFGLGVVSPISPIHVASTQKWFFLCPLLFQEFVKRLQQQYQEEMARGSATLNVEMGFKQSNVQPEKK